MACSTNINVKDKQKTFLCLFFQIAPSLQGYVSGCTDKDSFSSTTQIPSNMLTIQDFVVKSVFICVTEVLTGLEWMIYQQGDFANVFLQVFDANRSFKLLFHAINSCTVLQKCILSKMILSRCIFTILVIIWHEQMVHCPFSLLFLCLGVLGSHRLIQRQLLCASCEHMLPYIKITSLIIMRV